MFLVIQTLTMKKGLKSVGVAVCVHSTFKLMFNLLWCSCQKPGHLEEFLLLLLHHTIKNKADYPNLVRACKLKSHAQYCRVEFVCDSITQINVLHMDD